MKTREYPKRLRLRRMIYDALSGVSARRYGSVDNAADEIIRIIQNNYRRRIN